MIAAGETLGHVTLRDHNGEEITLDAPRWKVVFCFPKAGTPG